MPESSLLRKPPPTIVAHNLLHFLSFPHASEVFPDFDRTQGFFYFVGDISFSLNIFARRVLDSRKVHLVPFLFDLFYVDLSDVLFCVLVN